MEDPEAAMARACYAMFYAAEALLSERGLAFRKHAGCACLPRQVSGGRPASPAGGSAGAVTIQVEATAEAGYDPAWLRNAVEEPLDEAEVERRA
jgi:hypothetical protein